MRGKILTMSAIAGGLALGTAFSGLVPTRMADFANEPWRGVLQAEAHSAQPEEFQSRLAVNYDFLDSENDDPDREVDRPRRERGILGKSDNIAAPPTRVIQAKGFTPLGLADIGMTRHTPLPPPSTEKPAAQRKSSLQQSESENQADIRRSQLASEIY